MTIICFVLLPATLYTIVVNQFAAWLSRQFFQLRGKTAKRTDERISLMNEIINGIKVIKMYAWESSFAKLIEKTRRYVKEI